MSHAPSIRVQLWALSDATAQGKSTLLKIIAGIITPSSGRACADGRLAALLELGAGFNPELTGLENIYFNGTIMGYRRRDMSARLPEITAFADIGPYLDQPVKTYSSGMFVRLAFAVAINVDPDILLVDEALAVGDINFQARCFRKLNEFRNRGRTVVSLHTRWIPFCVTVTGPSCWIRDARRRTPIPRRL